MDKEARQNNWQIANLNAIKRRLVWLKEQPEGIIFSRPSGIHLGEHLNFGFIQN